MTKNRMNQIGLGVIAAAISCGVAQAQLHNGVRTVFLQSGGVNWGAPMNVAYDPNLNVYYTGGGGFPANDATVNDAGGNILSTVQVPADLRSWFYNPNTGNLELASYNAVNGDGVNYGLFNIGRDGSGYLTGTKSTILNSMPGLNGDQTMPAYDSVGNVLYSGTFPSTTVNKVDRATGSLLTTINLTGGPGSNGTYSVGYDRDENWLMLFDSNGSRVMVYDGTSGAYIGSAATDVAVANYGFGYANKQVWVYDGSRRGWQGYDIGAGGGGCPSDFTATKGGSCPGSNSLTWSGAPANSAVRVIYTTNNGSGGTIPPNSPCPGTTVCIGLGGVTLHPQVLHSNGSGNGSIPNFSAPCGMHLQLITQSTCKTSNRVDL